MSQAHNLMLMGNSPFALRLVVWARRLNNGVKHHGKQFDSGVRTANEEVQPGGDRVRSSSLDNIVHLMAIFAIKRDCSGIVFARLVQQV